MIRISHIKKEFPNRLLFEDAGVHIRPKERVGLVGPNGAGKTTLLRMVAKLDAPEEGTVQLAKNASLGYLRQDVTDMSANTVLEEVLQGFPEIAGIEGELLKLEQGMAKRPNDAALLRKYGQLQEKFDALEGYHLESKARSILTGVGFTPEQHKQPVRNFSGGWMMRIILAKLLIQKPDVLLMDEPTNHLDLNSIIWLEKFLAEYEGTVVLISHDQYFLNRVVNRVVEIDRRKLIDYTGDYESYIAQKALKMEQLQARFKSQQKQIKETERFIERFRYKSTKARQVQSRVKMLEKMEKVELPENSAPKLRFKFPQPARSGDIVAELTRVQKSYGDNVVYRDLNLLVKRGEKVALVGHNGAGKSTLLKVLADQVDIQSGEVRLGHNVTAYYYAQHQLDVLDAEKTILEELSSSAPDLNEQEIRRVAGVFLFSGDDVFKKVAILSGGEKARVALAKMLVRPANFLILDEPTNHLDIQARKVLQESLSEFQGSILFISHDRRLIDGIATSVIEITQGRLREYPGDYSYYTWKKAKEAREAEANDQDSIAPKTHSSAPAANKKIDRKARARVRAERRKRLKPLRDERAKVEKEITALELEKESLTEALCQPEVIADQVVFPQKSKRLNDVTALLDEKFLSWAEISERLETEEALLKKEGML